jgi:hypothetical protein
MLTVTVMLQNLYTAAFDVLWVDRVIAACNIVVVAAAAAGGGGAKACTHHNLIAYACIC